MRGIEQIPWLYDAICAVSEWRGLARWRRWVTDGARGLTLDLGCGTGRNLPLFAPTVRAVGIDPSFDSLRRARRRAPGAALVQARAEALPFRSGCFDTVVSGLVLCSVPDPSLGLAEIRRVLRADGTLRALEHVRATTAWRARVQDAIQPAWTWLAGGCRPNRDTEGAVEAAGFAIEPEGRRAQANLRRFAARASPCGYNALVSGPGVTEFDERH
jgi:ubiquinone/menaquinone biosynthesis C-methylase UbiE